jgi:phage/plasmid-like protein (TIGR03299 family)
MSAEIENMFSVVETPWHGLGKVLPGAPNVDEAIVMAGLDWEAQLHRNYIRVEGVEHQTSTYAVVRSTDKSILGTVGPTFKPLQNRDAFKWFQPWLDAGEATLETAGSLKHGRRVWVLAKVTRPNMEIVPGDEVAKFILLSNGHDGTMAVRAGLTPVRVVCANTLAAAHEDGGSKLFRIRHTNSTTAALEQIREIANLADAKFEASKDEYRALARKGVRTEDLKAYVQKVFKPKLIEGGGPLVGEEEDDEDACKRVTENIIPLFENGRGTDIPGVRGTLWGAYNSVTEYLQHERGRSADNRLDSAWFGQGATLNQRALQTALKMAVG